MSRPPLVPRRGVVGAEADPVGSGRALGPGATGLPPPSAPTTPAAAMAPAPGLVARKDAVDRATLADAEAHSAALASNAPTSIEALGGAARMWDAAGPLVAIVGAPKNRPVLEAEGAGAAEGASPTAGLPPVGSAGFESAPDMEPRRGHAVTAARSNRDARGTGDWRSRVFFNDEKLKVGYRRYPFPLPPHRGI